MKEIFNNFKLYFPSIAKEVIEYHESDNEVIARLKSNEMIEYNDLTHSIRNLPKDSTNMTEMECRHEFGKRLQNLLMHKRITQKGLSQMTGISEVLISNYINGKTTPSFYNADKITKALNCSMDVFRYVD